MLIVSCLLRYRNVPISSSPLIKEREWFLCKGHRLADLAQRVRDPRGVSPVTPEDILHFHNREPLRCALEQVRGEVSTRHVFIDRVEDPQFLSGIDSFFQPFEEGHHFGKALPSQAPEFFRFGCKYHRIPQAAGGPG